MKLKLDELAAFFSCWLMIFFGVCTAECIGDYHINMDVWLLGCIALSTCGFFFFLLLSVGMLCPAYHLSYPHNNACCFNAFFSRRSPKIWVVFISQVADWNPFVWLLPVDIICVVQKCPKQRWDMMGSYFSITPGRNQWRAAQGGGERSEFEMCLAMACYFDDLKTGFRSFNS